MKRVYPSLLAVCIYMMAIAYPRITQAQCNCAPGVPATAITNPFTLSPTNLPSASLVFPAFDPSIGDLACARFDYDISGITTSGARNYADSTSLLNPANPDYSPTGRLQYIFNLLVAPTITGPGVSVVKTYTRIYGPDSLGAYGDPDDTITYGPENVFDHIVGSTNSSSLGALNGVGNIYFNYTISGGLTTIKGGFNYSQKIRTTYEGQFTLTYYWCPHAILATSIKNLTASQNGDAILLNWLTDNEQNNSNYEIQISQDGKSFHSIGTAERSSTSAGATAEYEYQYHPDKAFTGKLYFRIREVDANGKASYSTIVIVSPGGRGNGPVSYQAFPNPATNSLIFQFGSNQTGRYLLELVNTAGQVVQQKAVTLTGTSQIRLDLNPHPTKGLYYLRTVDQTRNQRYTTKVLIN